MTDRKAPRSLLPACDVCGKPYLPLRLEGGRLIHTRATACRECATWAGRTCVALVRLLAHRRSA